MSPLRSAFFLLFIFLATLAVTQAHCATSAPRHDNSLGVLEYVDNPNSYLFGKIVNMPESPNRVIVDGRRRFATIINFQPYATFNLFTEQVMFCGNQTEAFENLRGPVVVTYRTVAHETVQGVACHELEGAFTVPPPADQP